MGLGKEKTHGGHEACRGSNIPGKATPWASQDIPGYPGIENVDRDNPG